MRALVDNGSEPLSGAEFYMERMVMHYLILTLRIPSRHRLELGSADHR